MNVLQKQRIKEMCGKGETYAATAADIAVSENTVKSYCLRNQIGVIKELKGLGVGVFFEEQNLHSLSGDGELMLTILASYAQEESRSVSKNCKWRLLHEVYPKPPRLGVRLRIHGRGHKRREYQAA
jgi:hypothetical protein